MAYQVSRVNFEKYKIHYGMFNDLLDQLERDSHGEKTFSSRSALYKKVFPDNDFESCSTSIKNDGTDSSGLDAISSVAEKLISNLIDSGCKNSFRQFIDDVAELNDALNISMARPKKDGDIVRHGSFIVFNIVDVYRDVNFLVDVVNTLSNFCGRSETLKSAPYISTAHLILNCENHFIALRYSEEINSRRVYEYIFSERLSAVVSMYHTLNAADGTTKSVLKPLLDYYWQSLSSLNAWKLMIPEGISAFVERANLYLSNGVEFASADHAEDINNETINSVRKELLNIQKINVPTEL